nr:MAG TPA: hypothetical protein [Caudoviricetes sp.]
MAHSRAWQRNNPAAQAAHISGALLVKITYIQ